MRTVIAHVEGELLRNMRESQRDMNLIELAGVERVPFAEARRIHDRDRELWIEAASVYEIEHDDNAMFDSVYGCIYQTDDE